MSQSTVNQSLVETVQSKMAFAPPSAVIKDAERKGMLRAETQSSNPYARDHYNFQTCQFHDCLAPSAPKRHLEKNGFETIDLSNLKTTQAILEDIRQAEHISEADSSGLRRSLDRASFKLANGKRIRLLYIAPEGLILRKAGPNGLDVSAGEKMTGMNGHGGADMIHGDQDVYGIPLKQIMKGAAPWIFRHNTPDGTNKLSPFFLVNLWIPLEQITRPLTLMDRQTLNNKEHQLRYALPVETFLKRDETNSNNDIWMFLHDQKQKFYFSSEMNANSAYIFDTLGMPHGSFILPGEKAAEQSYLQLQSACEAIANKDLAALKEASVTQTFSLPDDTTAPLREAINNMQALLKEANLEGEKLLDQGNEWCELAKIAMARVVRKSIEMRVFAMVTPF